MQLEKRIMGLDDKVKLLQAENSRLKEKAAMPRKIFYENVDLKKRLKAILKHASLPDTY